MHTNVPAAQKALSNSLSEKIQSAIHKAGGWMGFDQYMQMALYTPGLGYYTGNLEKFGESGDFITAPEMGDLFGQCLAGQAQQVLSAMSGGDLLEFGAGSGALAASILNHLGEAQTLPGQYLILELSAELRARQQQTLAELAPEYLPRVKWMDSLPEAFSGVVVANEVLDAMPVKLFEQSSNGEVLELGVALNDVADTVSPFCWQPRPAEAALQRAVQSLSLELGSLPDGQGYRSELNFQAQAWIKSLADCLQQGVIFLVDYGFNQAEYYHPDRYMGTLMCHYRHHAHPDPFFLPGQQDITAHVDFSAVANAAESQGLRIEGYATQGGFLMSSDLLQHIPLDAPLKLQMQLAQQVKKLTLPHEMGELFKVLALSRGFEAGLSGFIQQDHRYKL